MLSPRRWILGPLRVGAVRNVLETSIRDRATIFMLHRFAVPELGVRGHTADNIREALAFLRRDRYELLSVREIVERLAEGRSTRRVVGFTIDDGYADHSEVGAPVFGEFDCPITTFVCTGFLDGSLWMWWDKIEVIFMRTEQRRIAITTSKGDEVYEWSDEAQRQTCQLAFTESCKRIPDGEKYSRIDQLAEIAGVELPSEPPEQYAPMSWDQLRRAEERGMTFGPHTVTHPILTQTDDAQSRREITDSWTRLQSQAARPQSVFCYPNGQPGDYGPREYATLEELGFEAAVTGSPGYSKLDTLALGSTAALQIQRFSYPGNQLDLLQTVSGFEHVKAKLRIGK